MEEEKIKLYQLFEDNLPQKLNKNKSFEKIDTKIDSHKFNKYNDSILKNFCYVEQQESKQNGDITNDTYKENNVYDNLNQINENDPVNSQDQTHKNSDLIEHNTKPEEPKLNEIITNDKNKENNLHDSLNQINETDTNNNEDQTEEKDVLNNSNNKLNNSQQYYNDSVSNKSFDELSGSEFCTNKTKPWETPGADITDWFNYGFNEETFNAYRKRYLRMKKQAAGKCNIAENNINTDLKQITIQRENWKSNPDYQKSNDISQNLDLIRPSPNCYQFQNYYETPEQNAYSAGNLKYKHDNFQINQDRFYPKTYTTQSSFYNYDFQTRRSNSYNSFEDTQSNSDSYSSKTTQYNPHYSYYTTPHNSDYYNNETLRYNFPDSFEDTQSNSDSCSSKTTQYNSHHNYEATQPNTDYYNKTSRYNFHPSYQATQPNSDCYNYETSRYDFHHSYEATQPNSENYNYKTSQYNFHDSFEATQWDNSAVLPKNERYPSWRRNRSRYARRNRL